VTFRYITGNVVPIADRDAAAAMPPYHLPNCFGCGPENPDRLGVEPKLEGDKIVAELSFPQRFEGGPGVVHGGATAAFFDDLIGFVAMAHMLPAVTARLEINYLQPMPIGVTIRGEAWLASRRGRKLFAEATGLGPAGQTFVEVQALFLGVGIEHFTRVLEGAQVPVFEQGEYYP
jgi:acyl-coenzyme A thioesterase PaaI-like protein